MEASHQSGSAETRAPDEGSSGAVRKVDALRADLDGPPLPPVNIGQSLALLRKDRGLTLRAAAAECSVSAATLSRIENGSLSPTYDVISNICAGFGIGIRELLGYGTRSRFSGWRSVTRAGTGRTLETPHYRYTFLCDDTAQNPFMVLRTEILRSSLEDFGPLLAHAGHEQLVVESGTVEVHLEHYAPARLEKGDSLAFDSALGHAVISLSEEPAVVLWICDGLDPA
ncbi:helix-turn-helix domain-containing protein [Amaricoccus macauensis]|uniref:helix-turn-helix domain-containing protein n=1 Tax=Amaricoccus macauensis TaxID=57001 RepID=UPI003C7EA12B